MSAARRRLRKRRRAQGYTPPPPDPMVEAVRQASRARIVYGAGCTWWDSITKTSTTGSGIPCCPHCRGVLFEVENEAEWWAGVDRAEREGRTGYRALIEWARGRCFRDFPALERAYAEAS